MSAPAWFWAALSSSHRIYTGSPCHSCQRAHAGSMLCDDGRTHAGTHSRSAFAWYASYPAGYSARISCGSRPARTATCPPLPVSLVCHYLQSTGIRGMHDDRLCHLRTYCMDCMELETAESKPPSSVQITQSASGWALTVSATVQTLREPHRLDERRRHAKDEDAWLNIHTLCPTVLPITPV